MYNLALAINGNTANYSLRVFYGGIVALFLSILLASLLHKRFHFTKKSFFTSISVIVFFSTASLLLAHIGILTGQDTKYAERYGRVAVVVCGQNIKFGQSSAFESSAGSTTNMIFADGRVVFRGYTDHVASNASVGEFFKSIGGSISSNIASIPYPASVSRLVPAGSIPESFTHTNPLGEKYLELKNGTQCDITQSKITTVVYSQSGNTGKFDKQIIQQKPEAYQMSKSPVGHEDCVVVVFGERGENPAYTCSGYPTADLIQTTAKPGATR